MCCEYPDDLWMTQEEWAFLGLLIKGCDWCRPFTPRQLELIDVFTERYKPEEESPTESAVETP